MQARMRRVSVSLNLKIFQIQSAICNLKFEFIGSGSSGLGRSRY